MGRAHATTLCTHRARIRRSCTWGGQAELVGGWRPLQRSIGPAFLVSHDACARGARIAPGPGLLRDRPRPPRCPRVPRAVLEQSARSPPPPARVERRSSPGRARSPRPRRRSSWSAVSTPSAVTARPSADANASVAVTIAVSSRDRPSPPTNDRSIFRPWTSNRLKYSSDENPVPKSSTTRPNAHVPELPERTVRDGRLVKHERLGDLEDEATTASMPVVAEDLRDLCREPGLDGLAGRDVDAHRRARPPSRGIDRSRSCRHAAIVTSRPSGTISPLSSASGMKSFGGISPRSGWRHRTRASKPTIAPVASSTMGW